MNKIPTNPPTAAAIITIGDFLPVVLVDGLPVLGEGADAVLPEPEEGAFCGDDDGFPPGKTELHVHLLVSSMYTVLSLTALPIPPNTIMLFPERTAECPMRAPGPFVRFVTGVDQTKLVADVAVANHTVSSDGVPPLEDIVPPPMRERKKKNK